MKLPRLNFGLIFVALICLFTAGGQQTAAASGPAAKLLFSTGFETTEGYDPGFTLVGQNGWVNFGSGGNGLVTNFFEGEGQQAFIGFSGPTNQDDTLSLWKPINFTPITNDQPIIRFSVLMGIQSATAPSTNHDDFRWSVYTIDGQRLFSLDFDGVEHVISYALDDGRGFVSTLTAFANYPELYDLVITMNFARNLWSASLNNLQVVNSQPISTTNSALNLGDIDAVWSIRTPGAPGDNYLLFDNYSVTAEALASMPPMLETVARLADGQFLLRLYGEPDLKYVIDASADLLNWTPVKTNSAPDGVSDFVDMNAPGFGQRFYRARQLP